LGAVLQTEPLNDLWTIDPATGMPRRALEFQWHSFLLHAASVLFDLTLSISAYKLLWSTTFTLKEKLSLATVLGFGSSNTCCSALGSLCISIKFQEVSGLRPRAGLNVSYIIELGAGIIIGSAPALKLLEKNKQRNTRWETRRESGSTERSELADIIV
jgi:hypothetical protein